MNTAHPSRRDWRREWPLPILFVILVGGEIFKRAIGADTVGAAGEIVAFVAFFGGALLGAFAVVRHAEELAHRFGEPYGTLILTISAISIEVVVIATIMLHGTNNPKLARDTMYSGWPAWSDSASCGAVFGITSKAITCKVQARF